MIAAVKDAPRLFLLGFLTLFLELVLIRYLAGSIWNLGYFPNLVLLAAFFGMGLGFLLQARLSEARSRRLFTAAPWALLLLAAGVRLLRPNVPGFGRDYGDVGGDLYFTSSPTATLLSLFAFPLWFLAIVVVFALVSQRTARFFSRFTPLRAYSLDIGGSCFGILAFMAASALQLPAWSWFLMLAPLFAAVRGPGRWRVVAPLVLVAALAHGDDRQLRSNPAHSGELEVRWSPYQKVEAAIFHPPRVQVFVNGIAHQEMLPAAALRATYYQRPYTVREARGAPAYRDVLIVGAGSGNDVAAALLNGAQHVDAVEIDPVLAGLGVRRHPERPYQDPRVTLHVGDGRAFLTRTERRYDLVVFALTDSLVKASPMAQLRLENYLFTEESLRRAFEVLSDSGDLVLYNYYRLSWVVDKNRRAIAEATGRVPEFLPTRGAGFAILRVGKDSPAASAADVPQDVDAATDDWPFPYLRQRGIPAPYQAALGLMAAGAAVLAFLVARGAGPAPGRLRARAGFAAMGLAFLLLETKGVTQFSLLFGTTWLNNSLVFLAVLVLVLLANTVAQRLEGPRALAISSALVLAFCALGYLVPLSTLLRVEDPVARFALASLLTFSPIFFANLVFGVAFREQQVPADLFGWNLAGAALGGILESASMATGYSALLLVVGGSYALVFWLLRPSVPGSPAGTMRASRTP
jgi:hypothetical protein